MASDEGSEENGKEERSANRVRAPEVIPETDSLPEMGKAAEPVIPAAGTQSNADSAAPAAQPFDIASIRIPDNAEPNSNAGPRIPASAKLAALARNPLAEAYEKAGSSTLARAMRDANIAGLGGSIADQIATGKIGGYGLIDREISSLASIMGRDAPGRSIADRMLGTGIGQDIAGRFLAEQRARDRHLHVIGGFVDRTALDAWARPLGGTNIARWAEFDTIGKSLAGLSRAERWATGIGSHSLADLATQHASKGNLADQASVLSGAVASLLGGIGSIGKSQTPQLDALLARNPIYAPTAQKLSIFAGALDVIGPGSASVAAFESLLGGWRTRSDLPPSFWRHPEERARRYRDAEVDPGLIDADNAELVEMLVETGVVEGETRGGRISAVVEAGPIKVRVSAARPRQGATRVLAAFELGMRGFVEAKLRAAMAASGDDPEKWFKQRMPGDVVKRSRERREAARLAGEPPAPPIAFVDLGDFIDIVTQGRNWPIFEPIFGSAEAFRVDIARLNAIRRPIAHLRPIDPVQLAETTLTVARLTRAITLDGGWEAAWDDED